MPQKAVNYLRRNAIALLALFLALGGTSYAALTISGSQIRNHTITPVKFDSKSLPGSIRAWVDVYAQGSPPRVSSSSPVRIERFAVGERITWTKLRFALSCMALATPESLSGQPLPVSVFFDRPNHLLNLYGTGASGYLDTFVAIVCP